MSEVGEEAPVWTKIIEPQRGLLDLRLGELWQYRDLIWQLVVRDFTGTYKQTLLGPFWFVIQPLLMTVAFSFLFGKMAKFTTDGLPHFVFYIAGLAPWNYLSDCVTKTAFTFTKNAPVFGKVYFPRLAVPIAGVISAFVGFGVRLCILIAGFSSTCGRMLRRCRPRRPYRAPSRACPAWIQTGASLWCHCSC
jgi:lipopolysaccharide transport system permease protein